MVDRRVTFDLGFALDSWVFRAIGWFRLQYSSDATCLGSGIDLDSPQQRTLDKALFASNLNYLATLNVMPLTLTHLAAYTNYS